MQFIKEIALSIAINKNNNSCNCNHISINSMTTNRFILLTIAILTVILLRYTIKYIYNNSETIHAIIASPIFTDQRLIGVA